MNLIQFYKKNKEILEDIVKFSENREIGYLLKNGSFGPRPSAIQNETDVLKYLEKGAISLHASVERWININLLKEKTSKKDLDENRLGWDLIIDIDSDNVDISKVAAKAIIETLREYNIEKIYVKYSGGKGFHIAIPWEIFPKTVEIERKGEFIEEETRKLFPDIARDIALYISNKIENKLEKELKLKYNLNFNNPFELIEIDTIAISSRHLIRCIYSINEKTGMLSIPIDYKKIEKFDPSIAKIENFIYEGIPFLTEDIEEKESNGLKRLIYDAISWKIANSLSEKINKYYYYLSIKKERETEEEVKSDIKNAKINLKEITEEYFPPCIKNILNGISDGRKRGVFILINFLYNIGWSWEKIEEKIKQWNESLEEPLRERYIEYQLEWHKKIYKQEKKYLTPNCNNEQYYKDMGVCTPDEICKLIKNPLSYPYKKYLHSKSEDRNQ